MNKHNKEVYFSKIPNSLLYSGLGEPSILSKLEYNLKSISIFDYIYSCSGVGNGVSRFTLEDMIIECGLKPDSHKGKSNDIFKSILSKLQKLKIIESDVDLYKIKQKELIMCRILLDMNNKFISINSNERDKILSISNIDNSQLFAYYLYIKGRVYKRSNDSNEAIMDGGRYENAFFGFSKVYEDLCITDVTAIKYNEILANLNLIRYKNFGTCYSESDNGKAIRLTPNFYTLFNGSEEEARRNLEEGFKMYQMMDFNRNIVFTGSPLLKDNRSLGGKLGSLKKKEKKGKITKEEIEQKDKIIEDMRDSFSEKYKMIELFNIVGKNVLLSEYYIDNQGLSDKYYNIETSLGLVDSITNELTVDYNYYKWAMIHYEEKGFKYMRNCISKYHTRNKTTRRWGAANPIDDYSDDEFNDLLS